MLLENKMKKVMAECYDNITSNQHHNNIYNVVKAMTTEIGGLFTEQDIIDITSVIKNNDNLLSEFTGVITKYKSLDVLDEDECFDDFSNITQKAFWLSLDKEEAAEMLKFNHDLINGSRMLRDDISEPSALSQLIGRCVQFKLAQPHYRRGGSLYNSKIIEKLEDVFGRMIFYYIMKGRSDYKYIFNHTICLMRKYVNKMCWGIRGKGMVIYLCGEIVKSMNNDVDDPGAYIIEKVKTLSNGQA